MNPIFKIMKKLSFVFVLFALLSFDNDFNYQVKNTNIEDNNLTQQWFATTGTTRNSYGTNYSINIRVKGSQGYGNCINIYEVQVSNGYGWSRKSHYSVYGQECTYYINEGGQQYYFRI